jgi:N-acetylmuramoyl-L-alanine amidase
MNRRSFLRKVFYACGTAYFVPDLITIQNVEAAVRRSQQQKKTNVKTKTMPTRWGTKASVHIEETYLQFRSLENRTDTNMIVIHHIGGTDRDVSAAEVHEWHLNNGWAGIGYHYVIRKNGTIERGRPRDTVGAHCYGYNQTSVGINVVGNFEEAEPTPEQITSLVALTATVCRFYRIDPAASDTIFGHRDLNSTACPGQNLYDMLGDIRSGIVQAM